jgi:hypothetical protein
MNSSFEDERQEKTWRAWNAHERERKALNPKPSTLNYSSEVSETTDRCCLR